MATRNANTKRATLLEHILLGLGLGLAGLLGVGLAVVLTTGPNAAQMPPSPPPPSLEQVVARCVAESRTHSGESRFDAYVVRGTSGARVLGAGDVAFYYFEKCLSMKDVAVFGPPHNGWLALERQEPRR